MKPNTYYSKNRERLLEQARLRNRIPTERRKGQFATVRSRAREAGIPFTITPDDLVFPETCPILEIPLTYGGSKWHSPSIDRVIPELGYVPGNVRVVSTLANSMKNGANLEQLKTFAKNIVSYMEN